MPCSEGATDSSQAKRAAADVPGGADANPLHIRAAQFLATRTHDPHGTRTAIGVTAQHATMDGAGGETTHRT